ncbi:TPA: 30S ribosomal protein S7 [candidate division WWE3 bacterium]|uniref:Small ribosomal subunit protein uS7 n=4 Tax=Katanobacteria TaxID=422282 RepID=A0A0G1KLC7_UNCKA|nr:MAG: 30S ribosomal protein S7 [candidate division WWE3 bacterium GW2011_GWA2_44_16]KKT84333.1 MAG: 30S ribosomal protein S7 [candidate division WWE3 bacterium GW2011_GWC2_44_9]OGC52228.1 MAG: 30S ribosomal protein S7 [candidate division WWE3 bacterium RIFCSPHIGHO2_01_FULL_43_9]HAZ29322.1 30S ribosomal protein S7 [candidate division WWE3 bacterium]
MRSGQVKKKVLLVDPVYKSKILNRVISLVMRDGEKKVAEGIVYGVLAKLAQEKKEALDMFEGAVKNVMPKTEVRSRRVGGATYQIPMPVRYERSEALAVRWLIGAARKKKGKPMVEKLTEELKNAHQGIGDAIKKRDDVHKMAEANKAFSHFKF